MKHKEADEVLKSAVAIVWKEEYCIVKSKVNYPNAFVNVHGGDEITVIGKKEDFKKDDILAIDEGWKIITLDIRRDLGVVGLVAKISKALAKKDISIFIICTYSTEQILVKKERLNDALKELKNLGVVI